MYIVILKILFSLAHTILTLLHSLFLPHNYNSIRTRTLTQLLPNHNYNSITTIAPSQLLPSNHNYNSITNITLSQP